MSDSIWNDPRITAYVLNELPEDQRQAFEAEIEASPELATAVAEARSVTGQLEGLFAAEVTPSLDQERRQVIVSPAPKRAWRTPMIALAIAASLLLLIGGPMLISRQQGIVVGQVGQEGPRIATKDEIRVYGREAAKGQPVPRSQYSESLETGRAADGSGADVANTDTFTFEGRRSLDRRSVADLTVIDGVVVDGGSNARKDKVIKEARRSLQQDPSATVPSTRYSEPPAASAQSAPNSSKIPGLGEPRLNSNKHFIKGAAELAPAAGIPLEVGRKESYKNLRTEAYPNATESLARVSVRKREDRPAPFGEIEAESNADALGQGPGLSGDKFEPITDNPFKRVSEHPMSTFSVDVDTASYSKTRDFLTRANQLPRPDAVRIEEMINYFDYDYQPPAADDSHPFTTHTVVTSCPWNDEHRLARIALKGKVIERKDRPQCNLVFLLDTSGSMNAPNKLPLVVEGMKMLLDQLDNKDKVAITVYAGSAGLVLDSTPAKKKKKIRSALTQLNAGGSTNGGAGIALAYQTARDNFISDGVNRVILCTDGDFNVGTTGTDALVRMVEQEAKGGIFLSVLGFGMGNHNDAMLEQVSGRGNGNYAFIDNEKEAHKVLVDQTSATLVTIAKDVKLQIEFNPLKVSSYRLIGYENRVLAKEDFNDDKKDAGEIGAGHAVTALYEIVPAGQEADESRPKVDDLKYQSEPKPTDAADSDEMMTLKLRYKAPDGETSTLVEFSVTDDGIEFVDADKDVRFAAAVAGFGMQLRRSEYKGSWTLSAVQKIAENSKGEDEHGLRSEFVELVKKASELMGQE